MDSQLYVHELILRTVSLVNRIAQHPRLAPELRSDVQQLRVDAERLAISAQAAVRLAGLHPTDGSPGTSRGASTILLVDDDHRLIECASRTLAAAGYAVITAASAEVAAGLVTEATPAAIVIDLHMEPVDGLAFLRWVRARPWTQQPRVAVLTGDYLVEDGVAGELRELGATLHLKPLWSDDLIELAKVLTDNGPHSAHQSAPRE